MSELLVLSTCPDRESAERIALALVGQRLAACVNLVPGLTSIYRWKGSVERAGEVLLLVKTTRARLPAVQEALVAAHPYELPEVVAVEVAGGLPGYLAWLRAETDPAED
ncbi:MAG TPA: divalent-cation tolerance protein CutA [Xanthomonadaceae bacterium]|nr:divalent-cation tolerance protein CutA [Xanthomonadaceae bacterium]